MRVLRKLATVVALLPIVLPLVAAIFIVSSICSLLGLMRDGGFLSRVTSQLIGFLLTSKLLGPKADIPVRDARVRDTAGNEHLVRVRGDFVAGNINVGDDVTIQGFDRRGTLMFWRGQNHRIGSDIRVKTR